MLLVKTIKNIFKRKFLKWQIDWKIDLFKLGKTEFCLYELPINLSSKINIKVQQFVHCEIQIVTN